MGETTESLLLEKIQECGNDLKEQRRENSTSHRELHEKINSIIEWKNSNQHKIDVAYEHACNHVDTGTWLSGRVFDVLRWAIGVVVSASIIIFVNSMLK